MKSQACEPCAKRKVRCDKEEPCSNCKRRKQDDCTYIEVSPFDRIKRLESIVRSLGADPDNVLPQTPLKAKAADGKSKDPVMLEEDGKPFYLESRAWQGWLGHGADHNPVAKNPFLTEKHPDALSSIIRSSSSVVVFPPPEHAAILWDTFKQRAYPLARISFEWKLQRLYDDAMKEEKSLGSAEAALMSAIFLMGAVNLTEEECTAQLRPRAYLLAEYQALCEEALSRTNIFCVTDLQVIEALTLYLMAGVDRLSTQSLWSLMGLILRNAEKLGIHRDGSLLGLPPVETEQRRRVWWQLQHLDLALAVKSGLTPETLKGDWDAKLPLNIEDEDLTEAMTEFPKERKGLTSRAYCLYAYWVLDQQRQFFRGDKSRFELSWQSNESLPQKTKDSLIDQIEEGLNDKFLRFCDPLKPVDTLLQISARALICGMRLRGIHPIIFSGKGNAEMREQQLTSCMQALEYNIAMNATPSIKCFQWWTKGMFPWHAFMCVLIESSQQTSNSKTKSIWDLLSRLYSANTHLSILSEDRRRAHAAELIVAAWKTIRLKATTQAVSAPRKPDFVTALEETLALRSAASKQDTGVAPDTLSLPTEQFDAGGFDLDFQDIDWAFWSSVD